MKITANDSPELTFVTQTTNRGDKPLAAELCLPALAGLTIGDLAHTRLFFADSQSPTTIPRGGYRGIHGFARAIRSGVYHPVHGCLQPPGRDRPDGPHRQPRAAHGQLRAPKGRRGRVRWRLLPGGVQPRGLAESDSTRAPAAPIRPSPSSPTAATGTRPSTRTHRVRQARNFAGSKHVSRRSSLRSASGFS